MVRRFLSPPSPAMGLRSGLSEAKTRRSKVKHIKKVTAVKLTVAEANMFDDIGDWFDDLGSDHKVKW